jgi:hypothetical protein
MSYLIKSILTGLFLFFCLAVYVHSEEPAFTGAEIKSPALSTIHSDRLRQIMSRLNELAYEREYTELGLDRLRAKQIDSLVTEAETLVDNADRLPEILTEGELTPEELITFRAVASQLYSEALLIQADIHADSYVNVDEGYRRLRQTCNACHNLFRTTK